MKTLSTLDDAPSGASTRPGAPHPGLLLLFSASTPLLRPIPLSASSPITLGRDDAGGSPLPDDRISRRHVRITLRAPADLASPDALLIEDLASRNGTFVDGARITGSVEVTAPRVIRAGNTLLIPVRDVRPFLAAQIADDGAFVIGPSLGRALADVAAAAITGDTVLLRGESGSGKENAARTFHANASPSGPFVAVNCAAIPGTVAERLLFGAKRGAYSGATDDADGFCAAADGGTLFLDEVGELSLDVQAKLLRFLETHEFFPLGASKPRKVRARVCCATHRDLRDAVARGTFRDDLYYRLATIQVRIPPLRERPEEIPWLVKHAVAASGRGMNVHATFVEACLMRPWPGNVRELLGSVRRALTAARGGTLLSAEHLDEEAGTPPASSRSAPPLAPLPSVGEAPQGDPISDIRVSRIPSSASGGGGPSSSASPASSEADAERQRYIEALQQTGGNQTRAADLLGVSRRTFIRRLEELDIPRPRVPPRAGGE